MSSARHDSGISDGQCVSHVLAVRVRSDSGVGMGLGMGKRRASIVVIWTAGGREAGVHVVQLLRLLLLMIQSAHTRERRTVAAGGTSTICFTRLRVGVERVGGGGILGLVVVVVVVVGGGRGLAVRVVGEGGRRVGS